MGSGKELLISASAKVLAFEHEQRNLQIEGTSGADTMQRLVDNVLGIAKE